MHRDPQFYLIRNRLIDFLVRRSGEIQSEMETGHRKDMETRIVRPGVLPENVADIEQSRNARSSPTG